MTEQIKTKAVAGKSASLYLTVALVVLAVGGGGALAWRWKHDHDQAIKAAMERKAKKKLQAKARQPEGTITVKDAGVQVLFGPIEMTVAAGEAGDVALRHLAVTKLLTPRQEEMLAAAQGMVQGATTAAPLKATDEQKQKLAALELEGRLVASTEQKSQLRTLCRAWQEAADKTGKSAAEKALFSALGEIGKGGELAMKQTLLNSVEQIKQILTPGQVERIKGSGKPPAKATSAAASRPKK